MKYPTSLLEKRKMTGAGLIAAERKRQIEEEGWSAEHDDRLAKGQLAKAAMCYCMEPGDDADDDKKVPPKEWPLKKKLWKPTADSRIRELEKAGALIAAEIDRLLRKECHS